MTDDIYKGSKDRVEDSAVVQSLINLRNELWANRGDPTSDMIAMKINSCLYRSYPDAHPPHGDSPNPWFRHRGGATAPDGLGDNPIIDTKAEDNTKILTRSAAFAPWHRIKWWRISKETRPAPEMG